MKRWSVFALIGGGICLASLASCTREREESGGQGDARVTARHNQPVLGSQGISGVKTPDNPYVEEAWPAGMDAGNEWAEEFGRAGTPEEKMQVMWRKQVSGPEDLAVLVRLALREPDEPLRQEAVKLISSFAGYDGSLADEVTELVVGGVHDPSKEVRTLAMEAALELSPEVRLGVYAKTLAVPDEEIRRMTAVELGRMRSKAAFETLLSGLTHPDPAFQQVVNSEIELLVHRSFGSHDEAIQWWRQNEQDFTENLINVGPNQ